MKLKNYLFAALLAAAPLGFTACDDDGMTVAPEVESAFTTRYPDAGRVEWDWEDGYYVADFYDDRYETEAWFTPGGEWVMTETDIPYAALPQAVKTAFEGSEYAGWRVDDVDQVERRDMETLYVLEVEYGHQEADLYYSGDGVLVKTVADGGQGGYLPPTLTDAMRDFIGTRYPGARLVEADWEKGLMEVDIVHEGRGKEVLFTAEGEWVSTSWDVRLADVPQAAKEAALAAYDGYRLDDADYVETPATNYYDLELEKTGSPDVHVRVTADGTLL